MSATGRGRERNPRDYYRTPAWCVEALLREELLSPDVFDPACGDGAILAAIQAHGAGHTVHAQELDHAVALEASQRLQVPVSVGDSLDEYACWPDADVVMNPPYRQAADFVRRALVEVPQRGKVCALLRLNFLGSSRKRLDIVGPGSELARVLVLPKRPSFTGDGRSDACEYAFFVWQVEHRGPTEVRVVRV
jgi:hypothetical protein